jgi:arabinogalactan endo-1,4-beta-galactosidase
VPGPAFRVALSVSPFTELLTRYGVAFSDQRSRATTPEALQRLFVAHGANEVFVRIGTTTTYRTGLGDHSLVHGLERARLAKDLGLPLNPELGLFNIYGDGRCQPSPDLSSDPELNRRPWTSLSLDEMTLALNRYGARTAREILDTGVTVRIWDIGNEVDFGVAGVAPRPMGGACDDTAGGPGWYRAPDGVDRSIGTMSLSTLLQLPQATRIAWLQLHVWPYEARMLAAVASGIRSIDPHARFSTHVSGVTAVQAAQAVAFYRAMRSGGFFPDELGFSFYPSGSDSPPDRLAAFKETVAAVHRAFRRPVFIAEFAYPAQPITQGPFTGWNHVLTNYPFTEQGQANLLRDLTAWGRTAGVSGIRPWAPETIVPAWEPFALFSRSGTLASARPALDAIERGLEP